MAAESTSIFQQLDSQLEQILASWNVYTLLIGLILVIYLIYPLFYYAEPDIYPLLLARQSAASPVRQPGESSSFRSLETPHGYPLKSGLNVKDPGAPKWTSGKDGDLRDIWKRAVSGPVGNDGKPTGEAGKVLTVLGKEEAIEYTFAKLSAEINAIGQHVKVHGEGRVAIYLPNSVELLVSLFAATFYGITPILVPTEQPLDTLAGILRETRAEVLIAGAGALPLTELLQQYKSLKQMIWVVERTSRHMDWNEVPEGVGGNADIAVWHDIIEDKASAPSELPTEVLGGTVPNILFVVEDGLSAMDSYEIIEFTQKNIVAAVGAQISVLPRNHSLAPTDLLTPLASLTEMYPLTVTLAALFSNASLALTPVSGPTVPYSSAFQGASPTIVIAGTQTLSNLCKHHERIQSHKIGIAHWWKSRSLETGVLPKVSGTSNPRLIYTYDKSNASNVPLSPLELFNLKLFTGARFVYAFTDPRVAGAVSQTNIFDYSKRGHGEDGKSHFGPPLSSVEIKMRDTGESKSEGGRSVGQLVISGPAIVGGQVVADQILCMTDENTLAYT